MTKSLGIVCTLKIQIVCIFTVHKIKNPMKYFLPLVFLIVLAAYQCKSKQVEAPAVDPMVLAESNFKQYCTPCHGDDGNVFVDRNWRHGNTKDSLVKSIMQGHADSLNPTWVKSFTDSDINSLTAYLGKAIDYRKSYDFTDSIISRDFHHQSMSVKLDTIAKGLGSPWGLGFLPNGDYVYSDRSGKLYRQSKGVQTEVKGVPKVFAQSQGGLLDIEVHPEFAKNNTIYLTYSKVRDSADVKLATTALMKAKLDGNTLKDAKDIFVALPWRSTPIHFGSRIEIDKDGKLFLTVGDRFQHLDTLPQKLDNDLGKIHRMNEDGTAPADNPFVNTPGARATIWSYGHRNPQSLKIHPETGVIWENEHGPRGGDELNLIEKGTNYGWPVISYGINYNGKIMTLFTQKEGMEQPKHKWIPSLGPSGMTIVTSDKYPAWKGDILMGSLRFKFLNRVHLNGNTPEDQEALLKNIGRVRMVEQGPDGFIYIGVEDKPGCIFKLVPLNAQMQ